MSSAEVESDRVSNRRLRAKPVLRRQGRRLASICLNPIDLTGQAC